MSKTFSIDMHVHTSRYSECAETLTPELIERYALAAGLDAIVITEHDTLWSQADMLELQQLCGQITLYNGIEVSTREGSHLVLLGIDEQGPLHKGISCEEAISYAHSKNGIAYLAHPYRNTLPPYPTIEKIDAIEIGSTSLHAKESQLARHLAKFAGKQPLGCSDAHALANIGWAYTSFPEPPADIDHLLDMIRRRQGVAVIPNSTVR